MDLASLIVKVGADIGDFTSAMKKGTGDLDAFAGQIEKATKALTVIGVGAALVAVGKQIVDAAREAGEFAERMEQLEQITGVSAQSLQEWGVALNRVGLSQDAIGQAMRVLSRQIVAAKEGSDEATQAFGRLGISISKTATAEEVFRQVADAMAKLPPGAERSAAAVELLGRAGQQMIPFLRGGAASLDEAAEAAAHMGAVLDQGQIKQLADMDDAFDDLGAATAALSRQVGSMFAPAIELAVRGLTEFTAWLTRTVMATKEAATALLNDLVYGFKLLGNVVESVSGIFSAVKAGTLDQWWASHKAGAQLISDEHDAIKALGQTSLDAVGKVDKLSTAQTSLSKSTDGAAQSLKKLQEDYKLYITGLTAMGEEELKMRAMLERARIASGGVEVAKGTAIRDAGIANFKNMQSVMWDEFIKESGAFEPLGGAPNHVQEALGKSAMFEALGEARESQAAFDAVTKSIVENNAKWDDAAVLHYQAAKSDAALTTGLWQSVATAIDRSVLGVILGTTKLNDAIKNSTQSVAVQLGGDFVSAVAKGNTALASTLGPWAAVAGGLALMVNRSDKMQAAFDRLGTALEPIWNLFGKVGDVLAPLIDLISRLLEPLKPLIDILATLLELGIKLNPMFQLMEITLRPIADLFDRLKPILEAFADAVETITSLIPGAGGGGPLDIVTGGGGGGGGIVETVAAVATFGLSEVFDFFAPGAVVTGPRKAVIGEAGPEAVIPLNSRGASFVSDALGLGGGGGMTVHVYVNGQVYGSVRDLARVLQPELDALVGYV